MKHFRSFWITALSLLLSDHAIAHEFAPSLLKVIQTQDHEYSVVWKTPAQRPGNAALQPFMPEGCEVVNRSPVVQEGTGLLTTWQLRCSGSGGNEVKTSLAGKSLSIAGLATNNASALVMLTLLDGRHYQKVLNGDDPSFVLLEEPNQLRVMKDYPMLGIAHILGGPDHLMFVFGLLLLVGSGARLIWTITAFTVGHSITLGMASLGLLDYPVALIEFAIAQIGRAHV